MAPATARFRRPRTLALDERGRLLVVESDIDDLLRVVDASLAPPTWMGPVDAAAQAEKAQQIEQLLGDYGKLVDDLADVVFIVEGRRFPVYRGMLSARSEYFLGQFKSEMQDGGTEEVCHEDVSASALHVLLRFFYTGELPAWEGGGREGAEGRVDRMGEPVGQGDEGGTSKQSKKGAGGKGGKGKAEDKDGDDGRGRV